METLVVSSFFLIGFLVVLAVWLLPLRETATAAIPERERLDLIIKGRSTLAQIAGGMFLFVGIFFTWRTFQLQQEGQFTDRYTKAIEQLGSTEEDVRLGGVYALGRLAWESRYERPQVANVLAAYVRTRSPWQDDELHTECRKRACGLTGEVGEPRGPLDVQAAVDILFRTKGGIRPAGPFDLTHCDLRGINLDHANLEDVLLNESYLGGARIPGADLKRAHILWACLPEYTDFADADFTDAAIDNTIFRVEVPKGAKGKPFPTTPDTFACGPTLPLPVNGRSHPLVM